MNIDVQVLKNIETQQGIGFDELLQTIASALLFAYTDNLETPRTRTTRRASTSTLKQAMSPSWSPNSTLMAKSSRSTTPPQ